MSDFGERTSWMSAGLVEQTNDDEVGTEKS